MGVQFDVVWCSAVVFFGLGCAQGAPTPDGFKADFGLGTSDAAAAPAVVDAGSPKPPASALPAFTGTACKMGERLECTCADGMSKGSQLCRFDATSPTMGALGSCDGCMPPVMMMPSAGSGAAGSGSAGSGSAGRAGSGSSAGSSAAGSRAAGSGGSSAAGSGGSSAAGSGGSSAAGSGGSSAAGSGAADAGTATACDPDMCPDPGGLLRSCCTDDGQCGGRLLGRCRVQD